MVQSSTINNLYKKYGPDRAVVNISGEYTTTGGYRVVEQDIDLTTLSTSAQTILADITFLSAGMRIESVEVITKTAATSSGNGTLDFGLVKVDRTTEIDFDGFIAAMPKTAIDTAGEKSTLTAGSTSAGALIGTNLGFTGYLVAKLGTAVYQTGVVRVRVNMYKP